MWLNIIIILYKNSMSFESQQNIKILWSIVQEIIEEKNITVNKNNKLSFVFDNVYQNVINIPQYKQLSIHSIDQLNKEFIKQFIQFLKNDNIFTLSDVYHSTDMNKNNNDSINKVFSNNNIDTNALSEDIITSRINEYEKYTNNF